MLSSWIASRYLRSKNAGRFTPLLTATAVASVAIGTLALIVVMSVMRGFRKELSSRMLGFDAHITLTKAAEGADLGRDEIEKFLAGADVRDIAPFVQGEVIAQTETAGGLTAQGARVRGVEPSELGAMSGVEYYFPEGSAGFESLKPSPPERKLAGAILGNEAAMQLGVHPDFGDTIELVAPLAEVTPSGELGPNKLSMEVAGVFRAGIFDYDSKYILTSMAEAKKLLGEQALAGWHIRLADAANVPSVLASLRPRLPAGWEAKGWNEENKKLFAALGLERVAMGGVLVMVLAIASFAIVGVILLVTASKRKDIAILESIGMTRKNITRIFVIQAAGIGAAGAAAGLAGGAAVCLSLERWPIRLPASYYLDRLPVDLDPVASIAFALVGVVIAAVVSIYPVRQALRLDPVEVLRYE